MPEASVAPPPTIHIQVVWTLPRRHLWSPQSQEAGVPILSLLRMRQPCTRRQEQGAGGPMRRHSCEGGRGSLQDYRGRL